MWDNVCVTCRQVMLKSHENSFVVMASNSCITFLNVLCFFVISWRLHDVISVKNLMPLLLLFLNFVLLTCIVAINISDDIPSLLYLHNDGGIEGISRIWILPKYLEVARMAVTWWIVAFLHSPFFYLMHFQTESWFCMEHICPSNDVI